jgi:hypothetical protein
VIALLIVGGIAGVVYWKRRQTKKGEEVLRNNYRQSVFNGTGGGGGADGGYGSLSSGEPGFKEKFSDSTSSVVGGGGVGVRGSVGGGMGGMNGMMLGKERERPMSYQSPSPYNMPPPPMNQGQYPPSGAPVPFSSPQENPFMSNQGGNPYGSLNQNQNNRHSLRNLTTPAIVTVPHPLSPAESGSFNHSSENGTR